MWVCPENCLQKKCGVCEHLLDILPDHKGNDGDACGLDKNGYAKKEKVCEKFACYWKNKDGSCSATEFARTGE